VSALEKAEFLYGVRPGWYDGNDDWRPAEVVAFRITRKTPRRVYYDAGLLAGRQPQIRFVDRHRLETDGEVTRKSGQWWEPDLTVYLQPPAVWPPAAPGLAVLKAEMAAAHPDRGGTGEAFIAARRRYELALKREAA
jgi:hypothetical protein